MELVILLCFCAALVICLILDVSLIYALLAGVVLFCIYGLRKGFGLRELGKMLWSGVSTIKGILVVFVLIGMLTGLWRRCGTIPVIITYAARLIRPNTLLLMTFLLCCGVSVLTGTSFGTAATMGVICMTMGATMGADPAWMGGAILSGAFFGDRCSPVSTSALLVSQLTNTTIFDNIKKMVKTAVVPFLLCCGIYALAGRSMTSGVYDTDLAAVFGRELVLHPAAVLPAAAILLLSAFRVHVRIAMLVSIVVSVIVCLLIQPHSLASLPAVMLLGYEAADAEVASLLNGGGVLPMVKIMAIVCISSSYAGIFRGTGLLDGIKEKLSTVSRYLSPFGTVLLTSAVTAMIACNQTLAIMLTHQLCRQLEPDDETMAIHLENSAVVVAPLVPWSIAGAVPLATLGAPTASLLAACFLYILPMWTLLRSRKHRS